MEHVLRTIYGQQAVARRRAIRDFSFSPDFLFCKIIRKSALPGSDRLRISRERHFRILAHKSKSLMSYQALLNCAGDLCAMDTSDPIDIPANPPNLKREVSIQHRTLCNGCFNPRVQRPTEQNCQEYKSSFSNRKLYYCSDHCRQILKAQDLAIAANLEVEALIKHKAGPLSGAKYEFVNNKVVFQ